MPGFGIIIDFQGILAEQGTAAKQRALSDMQKAANTVVAREWETRYAPKHFEDYAARRYQYAQRAASTIKKKERLARGGRVQHGGKRPLIWAGLLEQQMRRRGVLRVYPTRLTLRKASHVPKVPAKSKINLHAEVTKVIAEEATFLTKAAKAEFLAQLAAYKPRRRSGKGG
jgi:hypothetical protein